MVNNHQVIFTKIPPSMGYPEPNEYMKVKDVPFDLDAPLKDGEFIVKYLVSSISSIIHLAMTSSSGEGMFKDFAMKLGSPVSWGAAIGVVIKSSAGAKFQERDIVYGGGATYLEEYALVTKENDRHYELRNEILETKLPLSYYVGALGDIGFTAYTGLVKYGKPKSGETIYVSAAAGNVGIVVGQIGKALGLRLIGSAGSKQKLEFLKSIGYDEVFNYKTDDANIKLKELAPNGIDIYYDNVGGRALEVAIDHMKFRGRIISCGAQSQYFAGEKYGIRNLDRLVFKSLRMEGFLIFAEPKGEAEAFRARMTKWIQEGTIKPVETILEGIKAIPEGMTKIFSENVTGKIVVHIAEL